MSTLPNGGRLSHRGHDVQLVIETHGEATHLHAQISCDGKVVCAKAWTYPAPPSQEKIDQFIADVFVRIDRELDGELIDLMRLPVNASAQHTQI